MLETQKSQTQKEYDEKVLAQAKEIRELRAAQASKNASTSIAGGAGSGSGFNAGSEATTGFFSPEQVEAMKKRWRMQGIDESKFDGMVKQVEANSRVS